MSKDIDHIVYLQKKKQKMVFIKFWSKRFLIAFDVRFILWTYDLLCINELECPHPLHDEYVALVILLCKDGIFFQWTSGQ